MMEIMTQVPSDSVTTKMLASLGFRHPSDKSALLAAPS